MAKKGIKIISDLVKEAPNIARQRSNMELYEAIRDNNLVAISYRKLETNRIVRRIIEPYEFKEEETGLYLYAYDRTGRKRSTKSFLVNNILSAVKQERTFTPRVF